MNKKRLGILFKILLILTAIVIISVLLIKRFLYFKPTSESRKTRVVYKIFRVRHLYGWIYDENPSEKVVLFFIDRVGNVSYYEKEFMDIIKLGYNVITFDYSGFGKSGGVPTEKRILEDTSLVVQNVLSKYNRENIVIIGKGLGGVVASYAARRHKINRVILQEPLINIRDIFPKTIQTVFKFLFTEFDLQTYLHGYQGEVFLISDDMEKYKEISPYISEIIEYDEKNPYKKINNF